jgi:DNA-binding transcriptional MerR regulator
MMVTAEDQMITRREAAELAGVHINTVRLWESTGRVRTEKADNGVVLIPREDTERVIDTRHDATLSDKERIAALEVEVRMLREERDNALAERATLLARIIELAGGGGQ